MEERSVRWLIGHEVIRGEVRGELFGVSIAEPEHSDPLGGGQFGSVHWGDGGFEEGWQGFEVV